MPRAPVQKSCQAWTRCQDGQNTCQLSALVRREKSDSRLQLRCRPMRISAGSDSLPAERSCGGSWWWQAGQNCEVALHK